MYYVKTITGLILKADSKPINEPYMITDGYISNDNVVQSSNDIKDLFDFYLFIIDGNTYISDEFDFKLVSTEPNVLYYGCTLSEGANGAPMLVCRALYIGNNEWRIL